MSTPEERLLTKQSSKGFRKETSEQQRRHNNQECQRILSISPDERRRHNNQECQIVRREIPDYKQYETPEQRLIRKERERQLRHSHSHSNSHSSYSHSHRDHSDRYETNRKAKEIFISEQPPIFVSGGYGVIGGYGTIGGSGIPVMVSRSGSSVVLGPNVVMNGIPIPIVHPNGVSFIGPPGPFPFPAYTHYSI